MNYTIENGQYYKVIDAENNIILGELGEGDVLSTIHQVTFITEEEYLEAIESN